jgi:DNA polymerase I-like protein with 3'-5' exonuclease and polymerase domains
VIVHYVPMESSWSEDFLGNLRHSKFIDTALIAYRLAPGEPMKLASVIARELPEFSGWKGSTEEQLADPSTGGSMLGVTEESLLERCAVDACLTRRLYDKMWPRLTQVERDLHQEDVQISMFVSRMVRRGMYVSEERLIELRQTCVQIMQQEEEWLRQYTGVEGLNPGSTQQLGKIFSDRQVKVLPKRVWQQAALQGEECLPATDTGEVSTAGFALKLLRFNTGSENLKEFVTHVLAFRKAQDRLGDNVTAYALARDPGDMRVRGGYWPGTVSWRPASPTYGRKDRVNMLAVPRKGVRQIFTAPPVEVGDPDPWCFLEFDLSQAELRIMAQLSGDRVLIRGFREKWDFHRRMGSRVYELPEDQVNDSQRYVGKKGNFSCGYFIGDMGLWESFAGEDIILPFEIVRKLRSAYWSEYTDLRQYADEQRRVVRSGEYLYAPTGGYRWNLEQASLIHPKNEDEAINSVYNWTIQSVPPRLVYRIGLLLEDRIPETVMQIVNSVYDCLCMYVRKSQLVYVVREIERARQETMAREPWLRDVEIPGDVKVGDAWGTAKEYKLDE